MFQLVNLTPSEFDNTGKQCKKVHVPRVTHKRDRKSLSCQPCRKMKVSCDRHAPCQRCSKNKREDQCIYVAEPKQKDKGRAVEADGHSASRKRARVDDDHELEDRSDTMSIGKTASEGSPRALPPVSLETVKTPESMGKLVYKPGTLCPMDGRFGYHGGKVRFAGGSHWEHSATEFYKIQQSIQQIGGSLDQIYKEIKAAKKLYKTTWTKNFPFEFTQPKTREEVLDLLPPRDEVERLCITYLETVERTHRLLHIPSFWQELEIFWETPQDVDNGWLGQIFMMLAIACQVERISDVDCTPAEEQLQEGQVSRLLDGAQLCLMSTNFMWKPSMQALRTLCMIIIAKQMDMITHADSDTPYILNGIVTRLAISIGIHRDGDNFNEMPTFEREMRRRMWVTIVFMEIQSSVDSGLPLGVNFKDYDSKAPMNVNDTDITPGLSIKNSPYIHGEGDYTDSKYQILIAETFPLVLEIISRSNSAETRIPYDEVLEYDEKIQEYMAAAAKCLAVENIKVGREGVEEALATQAILLHKYLRRVSRTIHRQYSMLPSARTDYPDSYFKSLDYAVGFLLHRQKAVENSQGTWVCELLKDDFTHAIMTVFAELRLKRCKLSKDQMLKNIDPQETILQALKGCYEIASREIGLSTHHMRMHMGLGVMIASLEAKGASPELTVEMVRNAMMDTARLVRLKKGVEPTEKSRIIEDNKETTYHPWPNSGEQTTKMAYMSTLHLESFMEGVQFPINHVGGKPVEIMDIIQYFST